MSEPNPFSGPFAGVDNIGGNPLDDEAHVGPRCPKCKSENFRAWTNQYGVMRRCNVCKEEWTGSTAAAGRPVLGGPTLPLGVPAPDDDRPLVQYTGANFRDPSKTYGDDDY